MCWPGFTIPAVHLPATKIPATTIPATTIPATTIPGGCIAGRCYPPVHVPAVHVPAAHVPAVTIPATTIPAHRIPRTCFESAYALAPRATTIRVSNYSRIDRAFSPRLSRLYWQRAGRTVSFPSPLASGYGELNEAGFPKNQYVRSYFRRDGTFVNSYWRNSPTDGLPTCRIISC